MKAAVIVFPGSNRERDVVRALEQAGASVTKVWHADKTLPRGTDLAVLPGGFSYGDYLRSGAMAARSPVMRAVAQAAGRGVPVIGICNGFQVLTEAGLLPGALMRNAGLNFVCRPVPLKVENSQSLFTSGYSAGEEVTFPVAHHDGNYQADAETLDRLEGEGRVVARYTGANPNGSSRDIAAIANERGNVVGLMPHPEHAVDPLCGAGTDGLPFFTSVLQLVTARR